MYHENENKERTNEFGQYEYKVQEKVTTKKIEHDLLHSNEHDFWLLLILIPFFAFFVGLFIWLFMEYRSSSMGSLIYLIFFISFTVAVTIILIVASIYKLYMLLWGYKKFCVTIDRFRGIKTVVKHRRRKLRIHYYLMFNKYGQIEFSPELEYYTWSENYRMQGDGIRQSSRGGDRFFLIMRGKKIVYFYNDRMFDLSETLKTVRLIGEDSAAPEQNIESSSNNADGGGEEKIFH